MFLKLFFHHRSKKSTVSPCYTSDGRKKRKKQKYGDSGRSRSDPGVIGKTVFVSSVIATSPIVHNIVPVLTPNGTLEFRKNENQALSSSPRQPYDSTSSPAAGSSLDALRESRRVKRPAPTPSSTHTSPADKRTGSPGSANELSVFLKRAEPGRFSVRDRILQIQGGNYVVPVRQSGNHPVHLQESPREVTDNSDTGCTKGAPIVHHGTPPDAPPVIVEPVPCQVLLRAPLQHHRLRQDPLQHRQLKPQQQFNLEELEDLVHVRSRL